MARRISTFVQCLPPRDYERIRGVMITDSGTADQHLLVQMDGYCARLEDRVRAAELGTRRANQELAYAFWRWFIEPLPEMHCSRCISPTCAGARP